MILWSNHVPDEKQELDRGAVDHLARGILNSFNDHLDVKAEDRSPRKVYEILNALGWATGVVVAGASENADSEEELRAFVAAAIYSTVRRFDDRG